MDQSTALDILKTGRSVFLTGSAGSGKTYLLNQYISYLRDRNVAVAITASTGIAATHIGGSTIHSWSGIGVRDSLTKMEIENLAEKKYLQNRFLNTRVLIVDEISMLSAPMLDSVDRILRRFRDPFIPFGGLQIIFSGDFFQLPPIQNTVHTKFAYQSASWRELGPDVCYLQKNYRHNDSSFAATLQKIRDGVDDLEEILSLFRQCYRAKLVYDNPVFLHTHNLDVDQINSRQLAKISGPEHKFLSQESGNKKILETMRKSILAPGELVLKTGAQVIFVKNNFEEGYVNGTLGTIVDFEDFTRYPIVEISDGKKIVAAPESWRVTDEQGIKLAEIKQIPLRLAWAITVHKSQGMTLDYIETDLSKCFQPGQGYVALSRIKSFSGLRLVGGGVCNATFATDRRVKEFDGELYQLSKKLADSFSKKTKGEIEKGQNMFLKKIGGLLSNAEIEKNKRKKENGKLMKKIPSAEISRSMLNAGLNLGEIARERGLTTKTIIKHLTSCELFTDERECLKNFVSKKTLTEISKAIKKVSKDEKNFDKAGKLKLRPVYDELAGRVDWVDIHIAVYLHTGK